MSTEFPLHWEMWGCSYGYLWSEAASGGDTDKLARPQRMGRSTARKYNGVMETGGQREILRPYISCQEPHEAEQSLQLLY